MADVDQALQNLRDARSKAEEFGIDTEAAKLDENLLILGAIVGDLVDRMNRLERIVLAVSKGEA